MPIFFFVGGFSNYVTYTAMRERGETGGVVRAISSRSVAPALAGVLRGVGRGPGRAAPHGHGGAGRSDAVGRDDPASRLILPPGATVPFGPLWFLAVYLVVVALSPWTIALHRRFGLVGACRHGGGRGRSATSIGFGIDRPLVPVGQRGVRPAAATPTGALLRRRFDAASGPGRCSGRCSWSAWSVLWCSTTPDVFQLGGRCTLRLVPRASGTTPRACWAPMSSGSPTPIRPRCASCWAGSGRSGRRCSCGRCCTMAAANPRSGSRDDRRQQRDHDAVPVAHDRVPAGRAVAVAARVRPRPRQHPEVVAGTARCGSAYLR